MIRPRRIPRLPALLAGALLAGGCAPMTELRTSADAASHSLHQHVTRLTDRAMGRTSPAVLPEPVKVEIPMEVTR